MDDAGILTALNIGPDALLSRVRALSQQRPALFRYRLRAVLLAGYALLLAPLAAPLICLLVVFWPLVARDSGLRVLLAVLAANIALAAALVARRGGKAPRAQRQPGIALTREQAPELCGVVDALCAVLGLPAPAEIRITAQMDASLLRTWDAGLLGRRSYSLHIGLPLMKCLTCPQLRAVLAHELGHAHGALAARMTRIARLESHLRKLQEALAASTRPGARRLCRWYEGCLMQLHACALPLSRAGEHEADRIAARLTSAGALAEALVTALVAGEYWRGVYWPHIYAQMRHICHPAFFPFSSFGSVHLSVLRAEHVREYLEGPLAAKSGAKAPSPTLGERLHALDAGAVWAPPPAGCGAETLLGGERARLDAVFDEEWRRAVAPLWRRQYDAFNRRASVGTVVRCTAARRPK